MAGSYNHVVTSQGNLRSNERLVGMLENGGDVFEAVEQMFGMIWYLAEKLDGPADAESLDPEERLEKYKDVKLAVEEARLNYKTGLDASKMIHKLVPDQRRS
jgi:hypothetical protein